jgi:sodium-dependent dicarboxylate transporter 2/3/5
VFLIAAFFWALEIIPIYATSLVIVLLLIFLLAKPGGVLNMGEGGYTVFLVPASSPVIMLFLAGFLMASALYTPLLLSGGLNG